MMCSYFTSCGGGRRGLGNFLIAVCIAVFGFSYSARAVTVQKVTSPGGLEAWLVEDYSIPVISVKFGFEGGALTDLKGKEGRAAMAAALLIEGGAGDVTGQDLQKRLASRAIRLSFEGRLEDTVGLLKTTAQYRQQAFELLGLILAQPRFESDAVTRVRGQLVTSLKLSRERPRTLSELRLSEALYGDHPYARPIEGTVESVSSLNAGDMAAFMDAGISRDRLTIGVTGAVSPDELGVLLDQAFGVLPESSRVDAPRVAPEISVHFDGQVKHVEIDVPQSSVVFADEGVGYHDPDFYAASVLNYVLGAGGFSSRLMEEVREKRGLVYGIKTWFVGLDQASTLAGWFATDEKNVGKTIELVRQEWTRMRQEGPTADELEAAKKHMVGAWPLKFTSTDRIADFLYFLQGHDLPEDYFVQRNKHIQSVTMDDVRRVAERLLDADRLTFVVAGRLSKKQI